MSIKNIFPQMSQFEYILQADKDTRAGSREGKEELLFWGDYEGNLHEISERVQNLDFPPDRYRSFYVYEPKLRKIICSDYVTKVIQRAAYNALKPVVCKGFISDTYSCIEERGQLKAMQRLAEEVNYAYSSGKEWYYLKMDVEKFFYRIDHEILMRIIRKKIGDRKAVRLMEHYICEASMPFGLPLGVTNPMDIDEKDMLWDVGITIGGGLSHLYSNMYLDPLDQMVKRSLGVKIFNRYADDMIILSEDKDKLHRYKREIVDFLGDELKLRLNNKTAIRPISQGMEFVGYRVWPHKVTLRKSTSLRMKRNLKKKQELYRNYEITFEKVHDTVMSYKALMKHCDCKALDKKIFDDFVLTHNPKEAIDENG